MLTGLPDGALHHGDCSGAAGAIGGAVSAAGDGSRGPAAGRSDEEGGVARGII
jgi:hypothetical protein